MSDRPLLIFNFFQLFRRLFTILGQTNPRYFQVFFHREMGPRYVSLPKIFLCTLGIGLFAPFLRAFLPGITFIPLYLLPFAPHPSFRWVQDGKFTIGGSEFLPFWGLAIAFLITAVRRHLDGERRIINGEPLHSFAQGEPRFFEDETGTLAVKQPLIIFALGAAYSYAALLTGAFHPAFGSFLMVGALDLSLSAALIARYWSVSVQDQLDEELWATGFQQRVNEALGKKRRDFGHPPGVGDEEPAGFSRAGRGERT